MLKEAQDISRVDVCLYGRQTKVCGVESGVGGMRSIVITHGCLLLGRDLQDPCPHHFGNIET